MALIVPGAQSYIESIINKLANTAQAKERLVRDVPAFWLQQAAQSANVNIIALRTMLDAIDLELGNLDEEVGASPEGDSRERMNTRLLALRTMQANTLTNLKSVGTGNSAAPAFGVMTATVPVPSPTGWYDANSPYYTGTPNPVLWWVAP